MPIISPSILAANFANLQKEVEMINQSDADWIHWDIMDGRFVPNLTFGMAVTASLKRHSIKPFDVHLMVVEPEKYIEEFYNSGASILTVHFEAVTHLHRTIHSIKELGLKAGVALNPHTPVEVLEWILPDLDVVCLMSVNPGFYGQKFIEFTYSKINKLVQMRKHKNSSALIQIDGGVSSENAKKLVDTGADVLVAGNFIFKSDVPFDAIQFLKNIK